jgi:hypothetical protein
VRRYEKDPAFSLSLSNAKKGPVHLKIMLRQRAYWGKCPSSYIVKKCPAMRTSSMHSDMKTMRLKSLAFLYVIANHVN